MIPFPTESDRKNTEIAPSLALAAMSSVEYQPSTMAVASILVARGNDATPAANLDELMAILGPSWPQLDTVSIASRISFGKKAVACWWKAP